MPTDLNREGLEADGLDGYCTDCEHRVKIGPDGRCGAGHGRVILDNPQAYLAHANPDTAALVEALKPFAAIADEYSDDEEDDFQVWKDFDVLGATLPLKHFRAARAALSTVPAKSAEGEPVATDPARFMSDASRERLRPVVEALEQGINIQTTGEATNQIVAGMLRSCLDHIYELEADIAAAKTAIALASPPAAAGMPEGWVLVPVEPTTQMVDHGLDCISDQYLAGDWDEAKELAEDLDPAAIYRAMLADRPADGGR